MPVRPSLLIPLPGLPEKADVVEPAPLPLMRLRPAGVQRARLLTGLLAFWPCHETTGNPRLDSSVNSNTLSETNGTVAGTASGLIGGAAVFTGVATHYLKMAAGLIASGPFSYACWVNPTSVTTAGMAMSQGNAAGIRLTLTSSSVIWGFSANNAVFNTPLSVGAWAHLAGTFDGTTARLYVNGVLQATSVPTVSYSGVTFGLGAQSSNGGSGYNGALQLAGVWNRALTVPDVSALFNSGRGLDFAGFQA